MKKFKVLNEIERVGVVAVIREDTIEEALETAKACIEGGINAVEVTYTTPKASEVITRLKGELKGTKLLIGAGSVLDSETARVAILAGAEYIVSPAFDLDTARLCNRYQVPYMPGCMTITEVTKALEAGCDIIKMFPGSAFGPSFVKAIKGPIPQVNIMPTGGVNLSNVGEWVKNGVIAVGVGGQLTSGTFDEVVEKSKQFIDEVNRVRKELGYYEK